jgi:hypothetical protein
LRVATGAVDMAALGIAGSNAVVLLLLDSHGHLEGVPPPPLIGRSEFRFAPLRPVTAGRLHARTAQPHADARVPVGVAPAAVLALFFQRHVRT